MRTLTGVQGIGGAQELAEMLRQMGRGPDTMLAHITPDEAQMLLEAGGSGRINPMTGLPEFQPELSPYGEANEPLDFSMQDVPDYTGADFGFEVAQQTAPQPVDFRAQMRAADQPYYGAPTQAMQQFAQPTDMSQFDIGFGPGQFQPAIPETRGLELSPIRGMAPEQFQQFTADEMAQPAGIGDRLRGLEAGYRDFSQSYPMLSRLLTTGASSIPALLAARSARREGRAAAEELRSLGAPLRAEAEALRRQATTGGLTPQQARQEEARRASMRQAASTRGATTGTQQAMIENTLARERAGLAETNLNNAIRQLNLANAYDEAAIRAKLQSDTQASNILASIIGDLVRTTAGQPRGQAGGQMQMQPAMTEQPVTRRPEVR